jgi:peptide/nickel transport system substrate-binding protein
VVLVLILFAGALAGCGGAEQAKPAAPVPAAKKDAGFVLSVGWYAKMTSLDPGVHTSRFDSMVDASLYEPLIYELEPNKFRPGLAASWDVNKEMTEITIKLRQGLKLTDGTPINADLMIGNFDRIRDPKTASLRVGQFDDVKEYKKVDEYTFKVTFKVPYNRIINHFAGLWCSPNSLKAIKEKGTEYTMNIVAYGPYRVESWPDENTLVTVKNPDYKPPEFLKGPFPDKIIWKVIPEETSRIVALERGEVNLVFRPPNVEVPRLEKSANYSVVKFLSAGLPQGYMPNATRAPTNEKNVRLAMIYALDQNELCQLAWFGTNPGAKSCLASGNWAFWPESREVYKTDAAKAKQLLEEAGWKVNPKTGIREKNGKPLKIRLVASAGKEHEVATKRWRDVGFDAIFDSMAYEATVKRIADNEYEVARLGLAADDPSVLWSAFHSSQITGGSQFNRTRVADQKLDQMLDKGKNDPLSVDERKAVYIETQKYIMGNGWWIPSYEDTYVWAISKKLTGFSMDRTGNPLLLQMQQAPPATK